MRRRLVGGEASLTLVIRGQELYFRSPAEFGYFCAGRTNLPPERLLRIQAMSMDELRDEHQDLGMLQSRLAEIVVHAALDPELFRRQLWEIPGNSFTSDNDWRSLFAALREQDAGPQYLQTVIGHYLQYLAVRQQAFRMEPRQGGGESRLSGIDRLSMRHGKSTTRKDYQRLPKGRSIILEVAPGEPLELILSRHRCCFSIDDHLVFTHSNNQQEEIESKRIAIGRDKVNDIIIDPAWRDVSRLHLVIEDLGNGNIQMTDMSSHGTFLPVELMRRIKYRDAPTSSSGRDADGDDGLPDGEEDQTGPAKPSRHH